MFVIAFYKLKTSVNRGVRAKWPQLGLFCSGSPHRPCVLLSGSLTTVFPRAENWEEENAETEMEWWARRKGEEGRREDLRRHALYLLPP